MADDQIDMAAWRAWAKDADPGIEQQLEALLRLPVKEQIEYLVYLISSNGADSRRQSQIARDAAITAFNVGIR